MLFVKNMALPQEIEKLSTELMEGEGGCQCSLDKGKIP
jgi:hypothetical protein